MKHRNIVPILALLMALLSCDRPDQDIGARSQTRFVTDSRVSDLSIPFGVTTFSNKLVNDSRYVFAIRCDSSSVNGMRFAINNGEYEIKKTGNEHFAITGKVFGLNRTLGVNFATGKISYRVGSTQVELNEVDLKNMSPKNNVSFLFLYSLLGDRLSNQIQRFDYSQARIRVRYVTYYAIGAGATAVASAADADAFNQGNEVPLTTHGCVKMGRNTSCLWGESICITVDTFACSSSPGIIVGN